MNHHLARLAKSMAAALALFAIPSLAQSPTVDWSCYLPEDSSLQIKVQVFSGRPDPVFTIADSTMLHAIKSRLRYYCDSAAAPGNLFTCQGGLGYSGIVIEPTCFPTFNLCDHRIQVTRQIQNSYVVLHADSANELERMVISAVMREQVGMPDTGGAVYISDIVPDSLTAPVRKFGILTWEILSDSTRIDFSILDTPFCSLMQMAQEQVFPDIKLRWIVYSSVSPAFFRIDAPYSASQPIMVDWKTALQGGIMVTAKALDSLRLDFLKKVDALDTGCGSTFGCGDSGGGILIRSSERGLAYFKPISRYIGGIDRIYLFFAYTSDGTFDSASSTGTLSGFDKKGISPLRQVGSIGLFDLKGRRVIEMPGRNSSSNGIGSRRNIILNPGSEAYVRSPIAR
jgi:hypothetical protein